MADRKIKRALIAVYDKTGIVEFARTLVDEFGIEIISTGGTAKTLKDAGIPVTLVEQVTGFPEMLDGRVKTLHPKIHAAILADRDNPDHMRQIAEQGIEPIDMVVVNLYAFEKTVADPNCKFEDAIEMIDIGGPCLLRAASKNHKHVWAVCEPRLCREFLNVTRVSDVEFSAAEVESIRRTFAGIAFQKTSAYDRDINTYFLEVLARETQESFSRPEPSLPAVSAGVSKLIDELRYGENPHQRAGAYAPIRPRRELVLSSNVAAMSFNNHLDADSALTLCAELARAFPSHSICSFIKHTNACGVGVAGGHIEAYRRAYLCDPNAAMGGILACSFNVAAEFAAEVMETYDRLGKSLDAGGFFLEVWIAPLFDEPAVQVIRSRKKWGENVRLLSAGDLTQPPDPKAMQYRSIAGGMLVQSPDLLSLNEDQWKVVTKRAPTDSEMADLRLAWLIAKHTKSNAISICKDGMLIGNGAGQMSRVMSCRIATWLAKENGHADKLPGSAAASDAFFPFRDGPDLLIDAGVTAIIQPGGSKRDAETIAACDEKNVAMIFTGTRHFRH